MKDQLFGINLKIYRKAMGITQKQLGELTSVGQGSIANYEKGLRFPGEPTLRKIAESLNVSLNDLLDVKTTFKDINPDIKYNLDDFINLLLNEDISKSWNYLLNWKTGKSLSVLEVYSKILTPVLKKTGDLWFKGEFSIAEEHLISSKIRELIILTGDSDSKNLEHSGSRKKLWMGLSAPAEEHDLALYMASRLMKLDGWEVIFLGSGVPIPDLLKMIKKHSPDILCISITMKNNIEGLEAYLEVLGNQKNKNYGIIIGSTVFPEKKLKNYPQILGVAGELEDAIRIANQS